MNSAERIFAPALVATGLKCGLIAIAVLLTGAGLSADGSRVAASAIATFLVTAFEAALLEVAGRTWGAQRDDGWFVVAMVAGVAFGAGAVVLDLEDSLAAALFRCGWYAALALFWWHLLPRSAFNQDTGRLHG
jgi:transketolase C-terminal domain/subunit